MLIHRKQSSETPNAENLVVAVKEYIEKDGAVGVVGHDLVSNKDVTVFLTDRGKAADVKDRPKLSEFRDGGNLVSTQPGGVIAFNGAFGGREGNYIATWPNFMAGNAEDAKNVRVGLPISLRVMDGNNGKFGFAIVWQTGSIVSAPDMAKAEAALGTWVNQINKDTNARPAAIIRALNAAGEIVGYDYIEAHYVKDRQSNENADEVLERVRGYESFKALADTQAASFEVLPAAVLSLSSKGMAKRAKGYEAVAKSYVSGDNLLSKTTTYTMDTQGRFVDKVIPHQPYGGGVDPVQLGKDGNNRTFSPAFEAELYGTAEPAAEAGQAYEESPFPGAQA